MINSKPKIKFNDLISKKFKNTTETSINDKSF